MSGPDADWTGRRADARRNHELVLAAAIEVFTELGLDAPISEIATRAGVGKATVFRSYPTKADLVHAIGRQHVDWLHEVIERMSERAKVDAHLAIRDGLVDIMTRLAEDRLMIDVLSGLEGLNDEVTTHRTERILELGKEQGSLRADAIALDVRVLVSGAARSLTDLGVRDPDRWRRYALMILDALRP